MREGVAIFDFDRTMVRQESLAIFLRAIAGRRGYLAACFHAGVRGAMVAPKNRVDVFRAELLRRTLAGRTLREAENAAGWLFERLDWIGQTMEEFSRHQDAGRRLLVATGSLSVYMPVILNLKGVVVDGLLSTEMDVVDGVMTGEMATPSCTRNHKAVRVKAWLGQCQGEVWGYGNLPHDGPMLALTDHPTVVPV